MRPGSQQATGLVLVLAHGPGVGTPCLNSAVSDGLAGCSVTAAGPRAAREAAVGRCLSSVLLGETSRPHSAHLPGNERHWGASRGRRSGSEGWPASRGAPLAARPLVKPSVASVKTGPMLTWTSVVRPTHPPQRQAGRAAGLSIILSICGSADRRSRFSLGYLSLSVICR